MTTPEDIDVLLTEYRKVLEEMNNGTHTTRQKHDELMDESNRLLRLIDKHENNS